MGASFLYQKKANPQPKFAFFDFVNASQGAKRRRLQVRLPAL
jgi:hypothetical protein